MGATATRAARPGAAAMNGLNLLFTALAIFVFVLLIMWLVGAVA
jgi:uncharacterized membrane protein YqjE